MKGPRESTAPIEVAIIGAGCSGMAAAFALSNHRDRFHVTVFDKQDVCGGMATSSPIEGGKFGADYINDGVQGGSPQFTNTYKFFERMGFKSTPVEMQISFGKGRDGFWTNVFPSELVAKHSADIKKFGKALKTIKRLEPFFAVIPVEKMLKIFRFPKDFGDSLVYPLIALFMGTGNQTPHVSSAILERLFLDPSMRLFEFSETSLLDNVPTMYAFPRLGNIYAAWQKQLEEHGVRFLLNTEVTTIVDRKSGGSSWFSRRRDAHNVVLKYRDAKDQEAPEYTEGFDEIIFAADADSCLKILGKEATFMERRVLGNVKYFWDISVTHYDKEYMSKYYEMEYDPGMVAESRKNEKETQDAMRFAEVNFRPLYFIHMYPEDKKKIEMSFDLSVYQPQFRGIGPNGPQSEEEAHKMPTYEHPHVYQTIFLNKELSDKWTKDEIDKDKVVMEKWWKQQGHNWSLYLGTVPWLWWINGPKHTRYAGAWGLVNMHEVGICSGFAAAYQLGADYPFNNDNEARRLFSLVLGVLHLTRMRKEDRKGILA